MPLFFCLTSYKTISEFVAYDATFLFFGTDILTSTTSKKPA